MSVPARSIHGGLSILMPVLNGMPFLTETLESLEKQTFRDFSVLIWDNGSTDGTLELLSEWIPHRLPGRVFRGNPLSLGGSLAELVKASQTELCARIDADDICRPERFEVQLAYLAENPKTDVLGSQLDLIDSGGIPLGQRFSYPCSYTDIVCHMLANNPMGHPSIVFRRSAVLRAGNYDPNSTLEDYDLWLRMAPVAILENLPDVLVDYRIREESYTREAEKRGLLRQRIIKTLINNSQLSFGIGELEFEKLVRKEAANAFQLSKTISKHLAKIVGCPSSKILRNSYFFDSICALTSDTDTLSQLRFGYLRTGFLGVARAALSRWRKAQARQDP